MFLLNLLMLFYVSWISQCLLQPEKSPSSINRVVCLQRCLQRAMEKAARQTPALLHHPALPPASHAPVKTARSKSRLPIYTWTHTCINMSLSSYKRWDRKWLSLFPLKCQTDHTRTLVLWLSDEFSYVGEWTCRGSLMMHFVWILFFKCACESQVESLQVLIFAADLFSWSTELLENH